MICHQAGASLIVFIDLTDGFFSTTNSVLCFFVCLSLQKPSCSAQGCFPILLTHRGKIQELLMTMGGVRSLEGDSRVPHTDS